MNPWITEWIFRGLALNNSLEVAELLRYKETNEKVLWNRWDWRNGLAAEITLSGAPSAGLQIFLWDPLSHLIRLAIASV